MFVCVRAQTAWGQGGWVLGSLGNLPECVWWVLRQPLAGCPRGPGPEALPRAQLIHFLGQCLAPENVWVCEWPGAVYTGSRLLAMFVARYLLAQPACLFLSPLLTPQTAQV